MSDTPSPSDVGELFASFYAPEFRQQMLEAAMADRSAWWLEIAGDQTGADELRAKYPWPVIK